MLLVVATLIAHAGVAVVAEGRAVGHPTRLDATALYAPAARGYAPFPHRIELYNGAPDPLPLFAATLSVPTCVRPPELPEGTTIAPFGRFALELAPDPARPCDAAATVILVTSEGLGRVPLDRAVLQATFAPTTDASAEPPAPNPAPVLAPVPAPAPADTAPPAAPVPNPAPIRVPAPADTAPPAAPVPPALPPDPAPD